MGRVLAVGLIVSGLVLAACGESPQAAHRGTTVMSVPLIASPSPIPDTSAAWTPVVAAETQAAQLAVAEEQYATCVAYAGLNQSLVAASGAVAAPGHAVVPVDRSHSSRSTADREPGAPSSMRNST